jgi:hypothetical protein
MITKWPGEGKKLSSIIEDVCGGGGERPGVLDGNKTIINL